MALIHAYSQTVADGTATSVVRPSDWNSAHVQQWAISGNTLGSSNISGTDITLQGGNGVTISADTAGSKIVWSVATNYQSQGAYLTTAMQSNAATISNINVSAGTTSNNLSALTFSNANGLAFGLNGSVITGSYTVPSTAGLLSAVNVSAGTTSNNMSALTFSNLNGVSFGLNGSVVTGSVATSYRASNDAVGLNTALTAGPLAWTVGSAGISLNASSVAGTTSGFGGGSISGSMTHNTAGLNLSLSHPAWLTTAMQSNAATLSNINVSAGTTSNNLSAFVFSNSNGLAFGLSGSTVTGSYSQSTQGFSAAGGSSSFQTLGFSDNAYASWTNTDGSVALTELRGSFFAVSNTTQSSSGTQNIDAISFAGAGGVSVGVSNGSVVISGAAGGTTNQTGPNIAVPGTTITSGTVVFSNANGISFGLNGSTMTASATGANTISYYRLYELGNNTALTSYGQNSLYFQVFRPEENISMTAVQMLLSVSQASSNNAQTQGHTFSYGLYSKGTGASTSRYLSLATSSMFINQTANGNASWGYTIGQGTQSATGSNNASSAISTLFTGMKVINMPFNTNISVGGEYLLGFARSSSTAGVNNSLFTASHLVMTVLSGATGSFGAFDVTNGAQVTNTSRTQEFQQVVYTATSAAWPSAINNNQLSNNGATINHMYAWLEA